MCGRIEYVVTNTKTLEEHYGAKLIEGYTNQGFHYPKYNIPPTTHTPVLTSESTEEILIGHWGFVPSWAKDKPETKEVINARGNGAREIVL
jgi:putative SOS response-associated peptidase YedK